MVIVRETFTESPNKDKTSRSSHRQTLTYEQEPKAHEKARGRALEVVVGYDVE